MRTAMSYEDIVDDLRVNASREIARRRKVVTANIRGVRVKIWRHERYGRFFATADNLHQWTIDAPFTPAGLERIKRAAKYHFDTLNSERVTWRVEVERE